MQITVKLKEFRLSVPVMAAISISTAFMTASAVASGTAFPHIVIDAGSSSTKIYLYEVKPGSYPEVQQISSFKGVPGDEGVDNFLDRVGGLKRDTGPDGVGPALVAPLLEKVMPALKERHVKTGSVTVDFLATAGMRSALSPVGKHAPAEAEVLYGEIRKAIAAAGFKVGEVRTTDGSSEEGLWTWIDVNDRYRDAFRGSNTPVGIVEVGGSSMQVSFPTSATIDPAAGIYPVKINGKAFAVFDRTYLGLGSDDARRAMRALDPPADGGARCFPTGMNPEDDAGDVINGTSTRIKVFAKFDPSECAAAYAEVLGSHFAIAAPPDVEQSTSPFYGIAAVRYAFEEMGASPQLPTREGLSAAIEKNCSGPDAVKNFDMRKKFSQQACSSASYINALLYGPQGLFSEQSNLFKTTVADQVSIAPGVEGKISWTRGYLLQKYSE